ncbi:helix-turn-helix domain-containing protein [Paenibacillus sp. YIM B09110]|uniref:helix-turn-helix domain-containing protein n=1 Tax=Paenibacillus sp. YIM B09110 TaxID=3126102 RepID=UPI00301E3CCF
MGTVLQKSAAGYKSLGQMDPAGFKHHIAFETYQPPAGLTPFVLHFWTIRWHNTTGQPYISEQVMHRPYVDVFVSLPESGIQCTYRDRRDYEAADSGRIIGARLHPGAFHAFRNGSLAGLHNGTIALQDIFADADQAFVERTLALDDAAAVGALADLLQARNPQEDPQIAIVGRIIEAIEKEDMQTVKEVAQWTGMSDRWLQQLFQDYVGIGIKWQLQRNKLLQAASSIRINDAPDWADIAYELGYSSQQHFISDFKRVLGKTPTQYKRDLRDSYSHISDQVQ